uniref:DUF5666 domain-containing protein n=1 Tax=Geobacter metallireducens TaxID=28232 RepID=A0A831UAT9_GEOME
MKKTVSAIMMAAVMALSIATFGTTASAEEVKMIGVVEKIEMKGKEALVTLKDNKTGKNVVITVTDELTLDKFKDKRIKDGDEIRCKYDDAGGKNTSKLFRKTAGC